MNFSKKITTNEESLPTMNEMVEGLSNDLQKGKFISLDEFLAQRKRK